MSACWTLSEPLAIAYFTEDSTVPAIFWRELVMHFGKSQFSPPQQSHFDHNPARTGNKLSILWRISFITSKTIVWGFSILLFLITERKLVLRSTIGRRVSLESTKAKELFGSGRVRFYFWGRHSFARSEIGQMLAKSRVPRKISGSIAEWSFSTFEGFGFPALCHLHLDM
jgi:hypothetical protein